MRRNGSQLRQAGGKEEGVDAPQLVAVAVDNDKSSQFAIKWAADHILPKNEIFILLHVRRKITAIPSPSGLQIPITDMDDEIASAYLEQINLQTKELLLPFQCFCSRRGLQCREVILNDSDVPKAIVDYVIYQSVDKLVLGSSNRSAFMRPFKNMDVPTAVSKAAPEFCSVYIISKGKISSVRPATRPKKLSANKFQELDATGSHFQSVKSSPDVVGSSGIQNKRFESNLYDHSSFSNPQIRSPSGYGGSNWQTVSESVSNGLGHMPPIPKRESGFRSNLSLDDMESEISKLKLEVKQAMYLYEDSAQEANPGNMSFETMKTACLTEEMTGSSKVAFNKQRSRLPLPESPVATKLEKETNYENNVNNTWLQEIAEKRIELETISSNIRYRRYSVEEILKATDNFSDSLKVGEGGYGPVFKSTLDHTLVAIKILRSDVTQGIKQFHKEVEVLSCIRHPNMVLLMGACPEYGCLVYEYMSNGSLEDRLFCSPGTPPLSWQLRFKIAAEIATGLLFLHQTKPEPLVHRDLKPGNILLDSNFVCKIADVGLARLIPPSTIGATQCHMTATAGTFCYIDPEYQKSGLVSTKSDIYAFGIILLQLVTARPPMGLTHNVENSLEMGNFEQLLDPNLQNWPTEHALKLATLGLECAELRRKDRPDLATVVLPHLYELRDFAESTLNSSWQNSRWNSRSLREKSSLSGVEDFVIIERNRPTFTH